MSSFEHELDSFLTLGSDCGSNSFWC